MAAKHWFITGCATGFGRALAEAALARGDRVAASDRNRADIRDLEIAFPETALALQCDVTRPDEIANALDQANATLGQIDVLVNNAGYGLRAALEETTPEDARRLFDVNFFGMVDVIRSALPMLRAQGHGHIVNFASVGGRVSAPLLTLYNASKFAVEGLTEGLAPELAHLGITVTMVEPGAYATQFGPSAGSAGDPMEAYAPVRAMMDAHIGDLVMGKPEELAAAVLEMVDSPEPPLRFIAGNEARVMIDANLKSQLEENERWGALTLKASSAGR